MHTFIVKDRGTKCHLLVAWHSVLCTEYRGKQHWNSGRCIQWTPIRLSLFMYIVTCWFLFSFFWLRLENSARYQNLFKYQMHTGHCARLFYPGHNPSQGVHIQFPLSLLQSWLSIWQPMKLSTEVSIFASAKVEHAIGRIGIPYFISRPFCMHPGWHSNRALNV